MNFELQTIEIGPGDTRELYPVSVACGIGLAYSQNTRGTFTLFHVKSGLGIGYVTETEREALRFIELLAPLTDWNQPPESMAAVSENIGPKIREVYSQVRAESDALLKQLISPQLVQALEEYQQEHNPHFPLCAIVESAIEQYLGDEEDYERDEETVTSPFLADVHRELHRAQLEHDNLHSLHEAFAVILEEVDEFKAEVWKQSDARSQENLYSELVQIAAMCARTVEDGLVD